MPTVYTLTCFSARKVPPIVKQKAADGAKIPFGRVSPVDLPDPDLCNLHCSLGRVLHAAGAAEVVENIIKDEDDFFDGNTQFETVPSQNSEIAAHYLCRKLQSLRVQAY